MLWINTRHFNLADYEKVRKAIVTLTTTDWKGAGVGRLEVAEDLFAQILSYQTEPIEHFQFEVHHQRLDIHYVLEGEEIIEVSTEHPRETGYVSERDLSYVELPQTYSRVVMHAKDMLIIGMDEPHRTNGMVGDMPSRVQKIVLKVRH